MNIKEVKELVKMLDGTDIVEFTYESEGHKVSIKKGYDSIPQVASSFPGAHYPVPNYNQPLINPIPAPSQPALAEDKNEGLGPNQVYIVAPMVGTFYQSPSPDSDSYVQVGQVVEVGQVVCIIEAMKLMNEIESEWKGKIVEVLISNAQPVEFGQPLFVLEKI